jgi:hypothetical protein
MDKPLVFFGRVSMPIRQIRGITLIAASWSLELFLIAFLGIHSTIQQGIPRSPAPGVGRLSRLPRVPYISSNL